MMKSLLTLIFLGFLVSATSQTDGRHSSRAPNQEPTSFQKNENEIDAVVTENGTIESFGSSPVNMRHAKDCLERAEYSFEMKDYYATLVNTGIISTNEAREALGKDPIDGFDEPRIPVNLAGSSVNPQEGGRPTESSPIEEE